jgi:uncharacterized protein
MTFDQNFGPWAFVTGATEGIGRSIAKELAEKKLNLVLVGRRAEALNQIAGEIRNKSGNVQVKILVLDVASENAMEQIRQATRDLEIGLFVAAAGFGSSGEFVKLPISDELDMIDVNCRAVVEQTHHFAGQMIGRKKGGIILFSSLVAFQGTPFSATYSATKSFIQNFAEALHFELKSKGVSVLATAPGPVNSGFATRAKMTMGQAATPDEVAGATLRALGSAVTVRPGFLSKFLGYSLLSLNRWGRIQVMKQIMRKMAHQ